MHEIIFYAKKICDRTKATPADARSAFIEAAKEADIFVDYMKKGK